MPRDENKKQVDIPWAFLFCAVVFMLTLSILLAWVSSGFSGLMDWASFWSVLLVGAVILVGGWRVIKTDRSLILPDWLGWLLLGAVILRLAVGVFWFIALPVVGHGSLAEQEGYVMADAYERDKEAWKLARSEEPLWEAFKSYRKVDQYGGLLFLSALVYRYVGGENHLPLLMVVLTAVISSFVVLFTWAFAYRVWGRQVASVAAVVLVLYPEAVLLGSSQMREAFMMTIAIAAFYGLIRFWQDRSWHGVIWMLGALLVCLPLSPPFGALLLGLLSLLGLVLMKRELRNQKWVYLVIMGVVLLTVVALWFALGQFAPEGVSNPLEIVRWWFMKSADWQAYLSERSSGWIQKIFRTTPQWMHAPILLSYGVVQPFLPAALISRGVPIWKGIAIWRSIGWTLLLAFLLYVPFRAVRKPGDRRLELGLSVVVWLVILIASFRGGGDQWDNPRYRAAFVGLQVLLVSWVWIAQRRQGDPWLRRCVIGVMIILAWFIPWYLRRYSPLSWPVVDLFKTLGLGLVSAVLFITWDMVRGGNVEGGDK